SYKTKKDVSSYTYHKYANATNIPIFYRKTFPYETFIDTKSAGEVVSTLFRFSNFILLVNASLLIYFIKKYIDIWVVPFVKTKLGYLGRLVSLIIMSAQQLCMSDGKGLCV